MTLPKWTLCISLFGLGVLSLGIPTLSLAYQDAKVTENSTKVYEKPSSDSSRLTHLKKGQVIKASNQWVTDMEGLNWYKVFAEGQFGYVKANNLETISIKRELAGIKIESSNIKLSDEHVRSWSFLLRGMLSTAPLWIPLDDPSIGKELELTYSIPFSEDGIWRHFISVGAAYLNYVPNTPIWAGTVIMRVPTQWRLQPEFRMRAGIGPSGSPQFGGAFGFQYPFSLHYGAHLSAYGEIGSMLFNSGSAYYLFGSLGFGIHFF